MLLRSSDVAKELLGGCSGTLGAYAKTGACPFWTDMEKVSCPHRFLFGGFRRFKVDCSIDVATRNCAPSVSLYTAWPPDV